MASKVRNVILCLSCLLLFVGPSSSLLETLVQGQEVKNGDELVSAQGNFKLGFFTLESNNYYLGIWYNDNRQRQDNLVWVANRDTPIFNNSGSITIDDNGNLKISHDGGLPIVLYSGQEGSNTSAVLLDTGMKLGVNRKTGHTWSLTSWRGVVVPDSGVFTFGMDSNHTNQLVILWHNNIYWTSGSLERGHFTSSFSGISDSYYNFSYISNENETFFNYSVETSFTKSPRLVIDYLGRLSDDRGILVDCNSRFSGSSKMERCMLAQLPECRSPDDVFYSHFTFMYSDGFKFSESENLTLMDCEAKCLNNCSCVAYASTIEDAQTGCEIWTSTPARFNGSSNSNARTINFLNSAIANKVENRRANRWWRWLIMAVGAFIISLY